MFEIWIEDELQFEYADAADAVRTFAAQSRGYDATLEKQGVILARTSACRGLVSSSALYEAW